MSKQVVNVDYNSKEFFKGRDREYSRYEIKRIYVELPQNERNIDKLYKITGVAKYHLKELQKVDNWNEEASKEDSFRLLAKKKEQEMMSEETRQQYIQARYEMDKKLFNTAKDILDSQDFNQKLQDLAQDVYECGGVKETKELFTLLEKIMNNYKSTIGIQDAPKVANLTQINNYDMRDTVRQELLDNGIIEVDYEDEN